MSDDKFKLQFVYGTGHKFLYHYESTEKYLAATLSDQKIHCSVPSNFNDPWDCKPWFDGGCVDDPVEFDHLLDWFHGQANPKLAPRLRTKLDDGLRCDRDKRIEFINGISKRNIQEIEKRGIYCLTPFVTSELMWAHYGDHHRGICLQFGIDNELVKTAAKVYYTKEYQSWKPQEMFSPRAIEMVLTKSEAWLYEQEFRIVGLLRPDPKKESYVVPEGDFFRLPPNSLKAVIAGCASDCEQIKKIVNRNAPGLPVKRAIRIPDKYELKIEDR